MRTTALAGAILCAGLLVACTSAESNLEPRGGGEAAEQPAAEDPTGAPPAVDPVTRTAVFDGVEVSVAVGPLAVEGDLGVLRLEFDADDEVRIAAALEDPYVHGAYQPSLVQVIDVEAGTVADIAWSASGQAATQDVGMLGPGADATVLFAAYAAPAGDDVAVFIPQVGIVPGVPVIDADDAGDFASAADLTDDDPSTLTRPIAHLDTYTVEFDGDLSTRNDERGSLMTVDADVLFEKDSADLDAAADRSLDRIAERLAAAGGGELTITGHTDDVGGYDHNLALSHARAESVADALGERVDLGAFEATIEGRAYDEPVVDDTSEEARAANRRVEILIEARAADSAATSSGGDLPEPEGPVAPGADGVEVSSPGATFRVALDEVYRLGDHLVGEIELTNSGTEPVTLISVLASGATDSRGTRDVTLQMAANKLTLLDGDTRVHPVDYLTPDRDYVMSGGDRKPLADRVLKDLEPGQTRVVTVVWPAVAGESVTVDSPQLLTTLGGSVRGGPPFRLTDVPVVDAPSD